MLKVLSLFVPISSFAVVVIVVVLCLQLHVWGRESGDSECFGCHS